MLCHLEPKPLVLFGLEGKRNMGVENLPIFFLIMVGVGFTIVFIGIVRLAGIHEDEQYYISMNQKDDSKNLEELFSYFLEEEEKKNQDFREMVLETSKNKEEKESVLTQQSIDKNTNRLSQQQAEKQVFNEIIKRYKEGESVEEIAKNLKKGIGEVKLVISLYSMR